MTFRKILSNITKDEWLFVGLICGLLMIITIFPVVYAYVDAPSGMQYNGLNTVGVADYSVYFSYINQVKAGNILLRDYFTSEPQTGGMLNIFWLGVGWLARILNLSAPIAYHLSRLLMIPVFCVIFYIFSSYIFTERKLRMWSLVFSGFASGLGGYLSDAFKSANFHSSIDLWVAEANVFFSMYINPHFVLSFALMILFFLLLLLAWENNNYKYSFLAGLTGLIWFNFHPYYAPYVLAIGFIFCLYLLAKTKKINVLYHLAISLSLSFISVAYHFYLSKADYVIGMRMIQNYTVTPPLPYVAAGFGFLLFFCFLGIYFIAKNYRQIPDKFVFLLIWPAVGLNLLYAPLSFNRRFTEGLEIPMIFLAVYCLANLIKYIRDHWGYWGNLLTNKVMLVFMFALLFCASSFVIIARDIFFAATHYSPFYFSDQYLQAVDWLGNNDSGQVILANKYNGHNLPGFINQQVFIGHGHETLHFTAKDKMADDFYANKYDQAQAYKFLTENHIGYIFYSTWEKSGMAIKLYEQPYLEQVFTNTQTAIYKVSSKGSLPAPGGNNLK
jgi:hypothetical protein